MRKEKYLRQVTEVWEDVHVPKAIDGNDRAVCWSLLNVEEWVPEFITVSMQEVYGTLKWWADKKIPVKICSLSSWNPKHFHNYYKGRHEADTKCKTWK